MNSDLILSDGCVFGECKCFSGPSVVLLWLVSMQTADPLSDLVEEDKKLNHTIKHKQSNKILQPDLRVHSGFMKMHVCCLWTTVCWTNIKEW